MQAPGEEIPGARENDRFIVFLRFPQVGLTKCLDILAKRSIIILFGIFNPNRRGRGQRRAKSEKRG
jgi:hypothetical protein